MKIKKIIKLMKLHILDIFRYSIYKFKNNIKNQKL